jgi:hypothetical protein
MKYPCLADIFAFLKKDSWKVYTKFALENNF